MLTGRESLLRVIGKPRRFLPNRGSILSATTTNSSFSCPSTPQIPYQKDENGKRDSVEIRSDGSGDTAEPVNCPVCGARLPGLDNSLINSHLDVCLAKGSKRKLSQVTLLQFNFSRCKGKIHSSQPVEEDNQVFPSDSKKSRTCDANYNLDELDGSEEYDNKHHPISSENKMFASCVEDLVVKDHADDKLATPSLLLDVQSPKPFLEECFDYCDISKVFIPTFIIGRRYGTRMELDAESRICLSRDPDNVKDPNAIKVSYADSEYNNMLGYIPRELAHYLSPLIDKFCLNFEGIIISIPKGPRAAVPIQIACKTFDLSDKLCCENIQEFKSLWRDALRAVELAKTDPSGKPRYLHNLVVLIQEGLKSNLHLFTNTEMSFLESFDSLPDDSKRLFARLYTRKGFMLGPWFRMSNISYPEIGDCDLAVKGLLGYISSFQRSNELDDNHLEEVLNILNIDELWGALRVLNKKCNRGTRKHEIIDLLLSLNKDGLCHELRSFVLEVTGSCVKVSPLAESLLWRAERLFFLNGEQNLSAFLLVDLGIVKYPAYRCIISEPIFSNRSDLLLYEEAIEISQIMVESLDENNSELGLRCIEISVARMSISFEEVRSSTGESMATFWSHFSASWVYSKVVLLGVSFLEHEKSTFISDRRRGYWTLRLSVDLEHLGRVEDSLQVAENGLLDPWVRAGARIALQRRVLRLGKPPRRWKIPSYSKSVKRKIFEVHVQGRPLNCKTGMKSVFYGEDGERCGVEQLALQYYAGVGGGWQGVHTESGIWLTIFGILMWDIIFADVPNVFRNKFQTAPLDLETDTFYEARKSLIETHLDKIQDGMAEEILITSWESRVGTACRGVSWDKHSLPDLRAAVKCIGGPCLTSICRHLAQDYRSWSSGMPDLLLWRLHDCYRGEAKLVEVKGPRDRLSEQQRAWLLVLMDSGFSVEVCKVTPAPVAT
ncbi:hypothetical protein OROMI_026673 [Orobanche minor]